MKPSISVIIPYYNIEPILLQRAIKSVCSMEDLVDWELLIIDDGTYNSKAPQIINQLHHKRIRYYYQSNIGVAETRNKGITLATKEYILFLDADDYLYTSPLMACINLLCKEKPDMLSFNHECIENATFSDRPCKELPVTFCGTGCNYMTHHNIHGNPWHFFFKKEIANGLSFPTGIYHEDEEFAAMIYLRPQKLIVTSAIVYAYYQRPGSRMHQSDRHQIEKHYTDFITVISHLQDILPTLTTTERTALTRRIETLTSALLFLLISTPLNKKFILTIIEILRKKKLYPIPFRLYTWPYFIIYITSFKPFMLFLTRKIFHQLQKNNFFKSILEARK